MSYNYDDIKDSVQKFLEEIKGLTIVGSFKRKDTKINDLDFVTKRDLNDVLEDVKKYYDIKVVKHGKKYLQFKMDDLIFDVWKAEPEDFKHMIIMRSLDKGHSIGYKKKAKEKGFKLNDNGLFKSDSGERINIKSLKELKNILEV